MSKQYDEIAGEIVQEVIKARGQAIAGITNSTSQVHYVKELLSDEAVTELYKKVFAAINKPLA